MKLNAETARAAILAAIEADDDNHYYYGVRFENKARQVGDICENSKDNPDREDEREFPEYGTPEYDELPDLDGACAWNATDRRILDKTIRADRYGDGKTMTALTDHAYLIAGNYTTTDGGDDGEICIENAVVLAVIA